LHSGNFVHLNNLISKDAIINSLTLNHYTLKHRKRKGGQGHPVAVVVAAAAAGKGHHQRGSQGQSLLQGKIRTSTFLKT
jgi:hypothetical protein